MKKKLNELYQELTNLKSYYPSKKVNKLFSILVSLVLSKEKIILAENKVKNLRKICSLAESELELFWAKKILKSPNQRKEILKFPYYKNYKKLSGLEWDSLKKCVIHRNHKKALFIGGGPLPVTSIILAKDYGLKVEVLERDKSTADIASKLVKSINLNNKIKIKNISAEDFKGYDKFEVIFIASLVGDSTENKSTIFKIIKDKTKKDTHILARSAYGNRRLLYLPIDKTVYKDFTLVSKTHPKNKVINSILILKR